MIVKILMAASILGVSANPFCLALGSAAPLLIDIGIAILASRHFKANEDGWNSLKPYFYETIGHYFMGMVIPICFTNIFTPCYIGCLYRSGEKAPSLSNALYNNAKYNSLRPSEAYVYR